MGRKKGLGETLDFLTSQIYVDGKRKGLRLVMRRGAGGEGVEILGQAIGNLETRS